MFHDLIMGKVGAGCRAPARITNHGGEITDNQDRLMSEFLKLTQLRETYRVSKMNVRGRRIDSKLDSKRATKRQLTLQFSLTENLGTTGEKWSKLIKGGRHKLVGFNNRQTETRSQSGSFVEKFLDIVY